MNSPEESILPAFTDIGSKVKYNNISLYSDDLFDNEELLYYSLFNITPSTAKFRFTEKVNTYITENFINGKMRLLREHHDVRYTTYIKQFFIGDKNNLLISMGRSISKESFKTASDKPKSKDWACFIAYDSSNSDHLKLIADVSKMVDQYDDDRDMSLSVHFLEKEHGSLILTPHKLSHFPLDIQSHYNDDFAETHDKIVEWASDFDDKNKRLSLFHGIPGAGKTNYIKYLMTQLPDVRKIYISPFFVEAIADPSFMSFIKEYDSSILIAEDCESILQRREQSNNANAASILLNLTDGILASVLNFKIICTFNSDEKDIDPALMRKGRLFTKYKFDKLSKEKTAALYHKLYQKDPPEEEMELATIYNEAENGGVKKEEKRMGFL